MTVSPLELAALCAAFFCVALAYASVGFGGGSAYTAVLALAGTSPAAIPVVSLACNLIVATGGAVQFSRRGHLPGRRFWPIFVLSAPAAFVAGRHPLAPGSFYGLLGLALAVAAVALWSRGSSIDHEATRSPSTAAAIGTGAGLGTLAGFTGIGGGIYLSPLLMMRRWATPQQAAATSAVFIVVNSLFGLAGQLSKAGGREQAALVAPLGLAVVLGGSIGSRLGSSALSPAALRRGTALLAALVSVRLLARSVSLLYDGAVPWIP